MRTPSGVPYPPLGLANRVCSLEGRGEPFQAFEALGAETKAALLRMLPPDWSFEGKRVLDFGCGAGRTLRHFLAEAEAGAEFFGADIDGPSIDWLTQNLSPPLHPVRSEEAPPLDLGYGSFDLIWAISVFTHLTEHSCAWMAELHRLLRPAGLLIATYMGAWNSEVFTHEPWDEDRIGMNVLRSGQGWDDGGPMVLMSDWWVRAHWGRAFDVVALSPVHGQTWALLRKRDVEISAAALEAPADDPREYVALRNNLRQAELDHARMLHEARSVYENSLSWRVTRPLRRAARLARALRARVVRPR